MWVDHSSVKSLSQPPSQDADFPAAILALVRRDHIVHSLTFFPAALHDVFSCLFCDMLWLSRLHLTSPSVM